MSGLLRIKRLLNREEFRAAFVLVFVLHLCFTPFIWGTRTLLESARSVPSVLPQGAWYGKPSAQWPSAVLDPGAPGWTSEPWLALLRYQYLDEKTVPLWNPYQGFGQPLAANMQSQAFFPPVAALAVLLNPKTYNWYILLRLLFAGICTYLYLRFFVSFLAALAGGLASLLAGYYMLYLTIFHLSVEILLPAGLLVGEYLLRKQTFTRFLSFAAIILLVILAGNPESTLLVLTFLDLYLMFRIISDQGLRANWRPVTSKLLLANVTGVSLAAFLLLPFWEFLRRSFDSHQAGNLGGAVHGLRHDAIGRSVITYLFPLLFGPGQGKTGWTGIRNYIGLISVFLIIVACLAGFREIRRRAPLAFLTGFYLLAVATIVLKRYGFVGVNWVGRLPVYSLTDFPKYDEAILSICVAVLCAIGVERLIRKDISTRFQIAAVAIAFTAIPMTVMWCRPELHAEIALGDIEKGLSKFALGLPASLLILLALAIIVFGWKRPGIGGPSRGFSLAHCVVVLLVVEALFSYIVPTYYKLSKAPRETSNPYQGAPFVNLLKKQTGAYRIFARDGVLFPNWAAAFQISDIRDLDAMYDKKYFLFVKAFFAATGEDKSPNLQYRFNGIGSYEFRTPLERRLLQLSSAKFLGSETPYGIENRIVDRILETNKGHLVPGRGNLIARKGFLSNGVAYEGLGEHPPYQRLPYNVRVGEQQSIFHFAYGIDPAVFDKPGDGVGFTVEAKDAAGHISKLFYNYIDPKHHLAERRWMDGQVDLRPYRGQAIELLFSTDPGPRGNTAYDWAAWADFHFDKESENREMFRPIYQGEAQVYEYDDVLPRAALYTRADVMQSPAEVLRKLVDPALDVFGTVVLNGSELDPQQKQIVGKMDRQPPEREQAATITTYRSQAVEIHTARDRSAILVLTDTGYPGWKVQVDGRAGQWVAANYMFRGVFLSPGKHVVRFTYEPASFYLGLAISSATLLCLLIAALVRGRRGSASKRLPQAAAVPAYR